MKFEKTVFVWDGSIPLMVSSNRLSFRALRTADDPEFSRLVELSLSDTLDRHDRHSLTSMSASERAGTYLFPDPDHFAYRIEWWQVAYEPRGNPVGFLQPVLYHGSDRDGLAEGTIHFIGVHPGHRGRGYIHDLLRQATAVLQSVGVWRIYCDTDRENFPMVKAFQALGYRTG